MPKVTRSSKDNLEQPDDWSLVDAAVYWAEAHGIPVFPCLNKRPLTEQGFKDAVVDGPNVRALFAAHPHANMIGGAMGSATGLFCVDLDLYKGEAVLSWAEELHRQGLLPPTRVHETLRGGQHYIYAGDTQPNLIPTFGVEVKGEGSYIILPGGGAGYKVVSEDIALAPQGLLDFLKAKQRHRGEETVSDLIAKINRAEDFHDSISRIVAKMSVRGEDFAAISKIILGALESSLASNPNHPRYARWQQLVGDGGEEVSRAIRTGFQKFNPQAVSERMDAAIGKKADVAKVAFQQKTTPKEVADFSGFPFDGEGYFAHEQHDLLNQRFVMHPIFCEDESVLIAADPKTGKTAVSLTIGLHIACGIDVSKQLKVAEPRGVLYFGLEGKRAIRLRIAAWRQWMEEKGVELPERIPLFVVERSKNLLEDVERQELANAIKATDLWMEKEYGITTGAIFIDTYTKAMPGGDQNSVEDTSRVFDVVGRIRALGCPATVAFIHHKSRAGNVRGSSNIEADPDVITSINKSGNEIVWSLDRARSVEEGGSYHFSISNYELGNSVQGFAINAPVVEAVDYSAAAASGLEEAGKTNKIMGLIIALGSGKHHLADVNKVLDSAGVAPVKVNARTKRQTTARWESREAQDFYKSLIPVTGYIFAGYAVSRVINDGILDGISIREP